eukprot:gnl/TRDRNA2_/TRDRNA2_196767_c0_seq1.p1 gnl/TRDRNA2_/TRDRNA2_196767_c0~~gnl/TRDRNA2_/TRDRNA2_196767_c0_seq1.p1  ORF type:complete len:449 (+),score=104.70 gnl/TRDRNA2_/TRDRNA2_196767_c0_seq1:83-1429(+)
MGCTNAKSASENYKTAGGKEEEGKAPEKVFNETYELGKKLGEGSFGQVRMCRDKTTMKVCAVKILSTAGENPKKPDKAMVQAAQTELDIWAAVGKHPNCVELFKTYKGTLLWYFTVELCDCSLVDMLEKNEFDSEHELPRIFYEMMLGVAHMHTLDIVHCDIKPANYLLGLDKTTIKVTDFGLSARLPKNQKLRGVNGTAPFMSPEMLSNNGTGNYDTKTDVWSIGVAAYVMLFGEFPYMPKEMTAKGMKKAIVADHPKPRFAVAVESAWHPPEVAIDFVKSMLQRDATKRPTVKTALEHAFVKPAPVPEMKADRKASRKVSLKPQMQQNRVMSKEFKQAIDPTKQKSIEELLEELQGQAMRRSFSASGDGSDSTANLAKELPVRRNSRISTHSGVLSPTSSNPSNNNSDGQGSFNLKPLDVKVNVANIQAANGHANGHANGQANGKH